MNKSLTNSRITPRQAIIVYHDDPKSDFYLETRQIKGKGGAYTLLAAQPMSDTVLKELAKAFMKKTGIDMSFGGMISEHILYASNTPGLNIVMWYRPAMERKLNFDSQLKIKRATGMVRVPATLYVVVNTSLYLFALMTSDRPNVSTKIFRAPFFNIYDDGRVCMGTAPVGRNKAKTYELEAERFERAFYMAEQNGGLSKNVCKTALAPLWTSLIAKKQSFPSKQQLIQHPKYKNVGDFINKLIGKSKKYDQDEEEDEEFPGDFEDFDDEEEVEVGA